MLGDGFDKLNLYIDAIDKLMTDEKLRMTLARRATEYIREVHNVPKFIRDLRTVIKSNV